MAEKAVQPQIYFNGEFISKDGSRLPVSNHWVVILYGRKKKGKWDWSACQLTKTDSNGMMHPCVASLIFSDNTISVEYYESQDTAKIDLGDGGSKIHVKYLDVPLLLRQYIGLFIWPFSELRGKKVDIIELEKYRLIRKGFVGRLVGNNKAISLNCSLDLYIHRLKKYTDSANRKIKPYQERLDNSMKCAAVLDQAYNSIMARGKKIKQHLINIMQDVLVWSAIRKERHYVFIKAVEYNHNIEAQVIAGTVIEETKNQLAQYVKKITNWFNNHISNDVEVLWAMLKCHNHSWQFANTDWSQRNGRSIQGSGEAFPPEEIERVYSDAYIAILQTEHPVARHAYKTHLRIVIEGSAKGKHQATRAIQNITEKAAWLTKMTTGFAGIVSAAKSMQPPPDNKRDIRKSMYAACNYLEAQGLLVVNDAKGGLEAFEKEFQKALEGFHRKKRGEIKELVLGTLSDYFHFPVADMVKNFEAGWSSGVQALVAFEAFEKNREDVTKYLETSVEFASLGKSILEIPVIKDRVPEEIFHGTAVVGSFYDLGLSYYDMHKASDTGEAKDYAYTVVSYAGSGLVAGGSVLLLTPFAPLGGGLIAVGTAIKEIGPILKAIQEYKSDEYDEYGKLEEKLEEYDPTPNNQIFGFYEGYKYTSISSPNAQRIIDSYKADNPSWINDIDKAMEGYNFERFIEDFFEEHYWGSAFNKYYRDVKI